MKIQALTLPVSTIDWIYNHCLEFGLDYESSLIIADATVAMQWKPYDLKLDLKSILLP